jgi:hypothetical protein
MTPNLLLSLLTAILFGGALIVIVRPGAIRRLPIFLTIGLATGLGAGITSCFLFLWKVAGGNRPTLYIVIEMAILLLAAGVATLRLLKNKGSQAEVLPPRSPWPTMICLLLLAAALTALAFQCRQQPHGEWDAWAIWNQHARFIFRGGEHWKDGFIPEMHRSHPDYPLLLPASVARAWTWMGVESVAGPMMIAGLFMAATALTLYGLLLALSNGHRALTAVALLLGTPFFISLASYQYADTPLSFFILATLALSLMADSGTDGQKGYLVLAGVAAGLAAWTKNEGVLFVLAFVICRLAFTLRKEGVPSALRDFRSLLIGLLPVLFVIALFKVAYAPPNDLMSSAGSPTPLMSRLGDPSRWTFILGKMLEGIVAFGDWHLVGRALLSVPFVMAVWLLLSGIWKGRPAGIAVGCSSLALTLLGYIAVYAATPLDLAWHVGTSLTRLLMQLWPSAVMLFCLAAASPPGAESPAASPAPSR